MNELSTNWEGRSHCFEALEEVSEFDHELGRLVELRYFVGLSIEETAMLLGSPPASVKRGWTAARAWLYRRMTGEGLH